MCYDDRTHEPPRGFLSACASLILLNDRSFGAYPVFPCNFMMLSFACPQFALHWSLVSRRKIMTYFKIKVIEFAFDFFAGSTTGGWDVILGDIPPVLHFNVCYVFGT